MDTAHHLDLDFAARKRLDDHLDAVDEVLRKYQQPRHARAAIVDELENQVLELLGERVGKREATVGDLDPVLAEMDPPEAYARNSIDLASLPSAFGFPLQEPPRFNRATAAGLIWIGWFAFAVMFLVTLLSIQVSPEISSPSPPSFENGAMRSSDSHITVVAAMYAYQTWWGTLIIIFMCIPGLVAPVATTVLGWLGMAQIRQSGGREYGLGLAALNAWAFPILGGNLLVASVLSAAITFTMVNLVKENSPGTPMATLITTLLTLIFLAAFFYYNRRIILRIKRSLDS